MTSPTCLIASRLPNPSANRSASSKAIALAGDRNWTDLTVEADVKLVSSSYSLQHVAPGLMARVKSNPIDATDEFLSFNIYGNGVDWDAANTGCYMGSRVSDGQGGFTGWGPPANKSGVCAGIVKDKWYHLKMTVAGRWVRCSVDGQEVFNVLVPTDKLPATGAVGLFDNGSETADFDNVRVTR